MTGSLSNPSTGRRALILGAGDPDSRATASGFQLGGVDMPGGMGLMPTSA
ncbi:hypothetical protein ACSSVY_001652 [Roseovarius sp. MBR-51]